MAPKAKRSPKGNSKPAVKKDARRSTISQKDHEKEMARFRYQMTRNKSAVRKAFKKEVPSANKSSSPVGRTRGLLILW